MRDEEEIGTYDGTDGDSGIPAGWLRRQL